MNLTLYRLLTRLLWPFIAVFILLRLAKKKEDKKRLKERFGYASTHRPEGYLLWIHAASVGESISVLPLMQRIIDVYPSVHLLLTTGTVTSAQLLANKLPPRTFHQYIPVDNYGAVKRFLAFWKPNLALWTESELWPNLITETAQCCPLVMINGRLSPKSLEFWQPYPALRKKLMDSFSLCLAQSRADKERLTQMGASPFFLGNLKYEAPPLPATEETLESFKRNTEGRLVWVAASTHEGEDVQIADVHQRLKADYPHLMTIIAPRHPARGEAIAAELKTQGLQVALRSKQEAITPETDIYIANTLGELGLFFRVASIVFIGASLIAKGGHNPLEPARFGCAILMGPHVFNFTEICEDLTSQNALLIVQDKEELYQQLSQLFSYPNQQQTLGINALAMVKDTNRIGEKYLEALSPYLPVKEPKITRAFM